MILFDAGHFPAGKVCAEGEPPPHWPKLGGFATFIESTSSTFYAPFQNPPCMSTATAVSPATPIAGVAPAELNETTIMTVWPSNARYGLGRMLGKAYAITWPDIYIFRLGNLIALLSIPFAMVLFFLRIAPGIGCRYRLTNRRIVVERGISGLEDKAVDLDRFDSIEIVVQPGQAWYDAGDLVFKLGNVETFRLEGVSRPEAFRATCHKANLAHRQIKQIRERQRI